MVLEDVTHTSPRRYFFGGMPKRYKENSVSMTMEAIMEVLQDPELLARGVHGRERPWGGDDGLLPPCYPRYVVSVQPEYWCYFESCYIFTIPGTYRVHEVRFATRRHVSVVALSNHACSIKHPISIIKPVYICFPML